MQPQGPCGRCLRPGSANRRRSQMRLPCHPLISGLIGMGNKSIGPGSGGFLKKFKARLPRFARAAAVQISLLCVSRWWSIAAAGIRHHQGGRPAAAGGASTGRFASRSFASGAGCDPNGGAAQSPRRRIGTAFCRRHADARHVLGSHRRAGAASTMRGRRAARGVSVEARAAASVGVGLEQFHPDRKSRCKCVIPAEAGTQTAVVSCPNKLSAAAVGRESAPRSGPRTDRRGAADAAGQHRHPAPPYHPPAAECDPPGPPPPTRRASP